MLKLIACLFIVSFFFKTTTIAQTASDFQEHIYLTKTELAEYIKSAPFVNKLENASFPFDTLKYNKVIGYDLNGRNERYVSIDDAFNPNSFKYKPSIYAQKYFTQVELNFLMSFILKNETYGEQSSACFEPSMAIIFFQDDKLVFNITICLDCNASSTTVKLPAMEYSKQYFEDGTYYGFGGYSKKGQKKIIKLAKMLELGYADFKQKKR